MLIVIKHAAEGCTIIGGDKVANIFHTILERSVIVIGKGAVGAARRNSDLSERYVIGHGAILYTIGIGLFGRP